MKKFLLPALFAGLFLSSCAFRTREVMVEEPPHRNHDTIVRDQIPAEGGRKIPVVEQY